MNSAVKVTDGVRRTQVISAEVHHVKAGDMLFPTFAAGKDCKEIWQVLWTTKTGMLPERHSLMIFHSEEAAASFVRKHQPGTYLEDQWPGGDEARRKAIRTMIDERLPIDGAGNAGDEESPLAFDVLREAGVLTADGYQISPDVLSYLGKRRVSSLKRRFGENWSAAAEYEYCFAHFDRSSPAYVAALFRYHYYITDDDFAAGYHWRDLECLVHGVESAALATVTSRKAAGEKGGVRSSSDRSARRKDLVGKMEEIAARSPDLIKLGADALAEVAGDACVEKNPRLWSQGRRQVKEYLGEISRGEAGQDLKARYAALFARPVVVPFAKTA